MLNTACGSCFEDVDSCFDNKDLSAFYQQICADCENFEELKEAIVSIGVKHNARIKLPKFTLQIYTFVYQRLMDFSTTGKFAESEALITLNLFQNVHRVISVKVHLNHYHVIGKIHGYAHNFCNMKVRENSQIQFCCILHNFFYFDMFFLFKGIRLSVWETQDLNIGRSALTNINFASLGSQVKLIETMKYYPSSLGILTRTLDDVEKERVKELTLQFLSQHNYFSQIWQHKLTYDKKGRLKTLL